ncbi:DNA helicase rad5 [Rhizoclosmatium sp. JEL0117]|nr:DNA helicase rad5 [Rhizoclosmatium sp. JEL0117]
MATLGPPPTGAGSSAGVHNGAHSALALEIDDTEFEAEPLLMSLFIRDQLTDWLDKHELLKQEIEKNGRLRLFETVRTTERNDKVFCFSPNGPNKEPFECFDFIRIFCDSTSSYAPIKKTRCIYWLYIESMQDGKADFRLDIHHAIFPPPADPLYPFKPPPLNSLYIQFDTQLYDYQRRTLGWMENVEDGHDSVYYNPRMVKLDESTYFERPKIGYHNIVSAVGQLYSLEEAKKIAPSVKSGIIADKPGVGKTITTLALCQTRPYTNQEFLYTLDPVTLRFKSKATVIFVPNNIASQWMTEIKKWFGSSINAIEIKGKRGYETTRLKQILECDIVIVSYNFLTNNSYIAGKITSKSRTLNTHSPGTNFSVKETAQRFIDNLPAGKFAFSWIHFHRVVFDEFHEIDDKHQAIKTQLEIMKGDVMWGLTGTPKVDNQETVASFATYLNINLLNIWEYVPLDMSPWLGTSLSCKEFLINRVRRNEPEILYPPPVYETIRVTQTAMEMSLYRSSATNSNCANIENLVKLCNHYQIGNNLFQESGSAALSIEQVTQLVQTNRSAKIMSLTKQIECQVKVIEQCLEAMEKAVDPDLRKVCQISHKKALTEDCQMKEELRSMQSQFNFFQNFLNSYGSEDNKIFCSVCLDDDIPKDNLGLVPCGHVFCWGCAEGVADCNQKCPQCMTPIKQEQLMKLQPPTAALEAPKLSSEQVENDNGDMLDPDKFGSKIRELVQYLQREMAENDNNRFLVFIQWSDLADLVSKALNTFGIATARLKSGWTQREAALKKFREGLPSGSFEKVVESEVGLEDESKNGVLMDESLESELKTQMEKPMTNDVKGKGRALPLDLEEAQPLPPGTSARKTNPGTVLASDRDDMKAEVGVTEKKKGARRATTSLLQPAKKSRKTVNFKPDVCLKEDSSIEDESLGEVKTEKTVSQELKELESKAVKVLMLSAKDSVSGLNLTEATHCIIMHPFHDNKEDYAIGAEKQGVARTLRNGQTKTVKIVRFVVEQTVEQEMHDRRIDKLKD